MVAEPRKTDEHPTVIGADAHFKGELSFQGSVRIDGQFEGAISTPGSVLVSQGGRVKAEVHAGSVKIDGTVEGNVVCEARAELSPTCRLTGDLRAAKLQVHEGAAFVGRCEVGPNAGKGKDAPPSAPPLRQMSEAVAGKK
jgi:cytoskeletal protein CcmA (bactofilin family)